MMRWKSPQADRHHSGSAAHPVSNSGEDHATCPCAVLTMYRYDSIKKETKSKGDLALGVLQHLVNQRCSQKARTPRLIRDGLCQPPDDGCCLPKGRARLRRIAGCLIHPAQRRLDLPAFARQPQVCCQPCCLEQVADSLLALPLPRGKQSLRPQIGEAEAPIGSHTFPQSAD